MRNLKKRPATLIEVVIAMALTVIVLTTLTFFYQQVTVIGTEIDKVKTQDFYIRYVENRLSAVLPRVLAESDPDFAFFSMGDDGLTKPGTQNLIFTFDNGVSLDKLFSNQVVGRLFVDMDGRLTLAYWPTPKRWDKAEAAPMKKEILLEKVATMDLAFFIAPDTEKPEDKPAAESEGKKETTKGKKKAETTKEDSKKEESKKQEAEGEKVPEPEPKGDWRVQPWLKEYQKLPVMVKIKLTLAEEKKEMTFIFPLANSKAHIIYD